MSLEAYFQVPFSGTDCANSELQIPCKCSRIFSRGIMGLRHIWWKENLKIVLIFLLLAFFFLSRLRFDILSFLIQFPTLSSILDLSSLWLFLSFNYQ